MNLLSNVILAPAPPVGGGLGGALGGFTPVQLIIGLIVVLLGIALIFSAARGGHVTMPQINFSGLIRPILGLFLGIALISIFFSWSWPGWPVPAGASVLPVWSPPQWISDLFDSANRRVSPKPDVNTVGSQDAADILDRAVLDTYDIEHARIWGQVDYIADQELILASMYAMEINHTQTGPGSDRQVITQDQSGLTISETDVFTTTGIVTTTLQASGTLTDTFGYTVGRMWTVANRVAEAPRVSQDVWGEAMAHVEAVSYLALVAQREGKISQVPALINQSRNKLIDALPRVEAGARTCTEMPIGVINNHAEWVRENGRITACALAISAQLTSAKMQPNPNQARISELDEAAAELDAMLVVLDTTWINYSSAHLIPAVAPLNAGTPID